MTDHPPPPPPSSPPSGPSHPSSSTHLPVPPPTPPHSRPDRASPTDTMLAILSPPTTETMTTAPGQGPGPVLEPQDLTLPPTTTTTPRLAQSQAQASQQTPTTSAAFDYLTQPQRLSRDNCDRRRPPEDESAPRDRGLINMPPDLVGKTLSPFLKEHIPDLYAPIGKNNHKKTASASSTAVSVPSDSHSKYCYRHRPDSKCRRAADEKKMGIIQRDLDSLSTADQQAITHVWSTFSAAPSKQRELILQGIITQCCFPQLSAVSREVAEQLKIDFLATLPVELSYKILCYLDTVSLCKAAQVSRRWRALADDDVVWHRMCEQHIDRCCSKCGWGLPLLEKRRLKAWSRHQLTAHAADDAAAAAAAARAPVEEPSETPATPGSNKRVMGPARCDDATGGPSTAAMTTMTTMTTTATTTTTTTAAAATAAATTATTTSSLAVPRKRPRVQGSCRKSRAQLDEERKFRPWKDVYRDRYKIGWNWKTGRCSVRTFKGHSNGVTCLQMDNNILATGSYDTTIKIWNSETGAVIRTLRGHSQSIRSLQFDDSKLISASFDKTIKIWNWQTGECLSTLQCHSDGVLSVHFEGLTLASGSIDRTVKIFSFDTKQTFTLRGHTDWVNHVRVDAASRTVFSASDDLSVKLWDLDSKRCVRTYLGHVGQVQQILLMPADFEPDVDPAADRRGDRAADRTDAASTHSSTDPRGKTPSPEPPEPTSSSSTTTTTTATTTTSSSSSSGNGVHDRAAFGPGFLSDPSRPLPPRYMLTGGLDNTVRLWDVATGRCVRSMFGHVEGVWALAGDTIRVVTGANDSMVKIWEPRSGKCERSFTGHAGPVTCVGLGDSRMASGSEDGEVRLYSFDGDGDMAERGTPS